MSTKKREAICPTFWYLNKFYKIVPQLDKFTLTFFPYILQNILDLEKLITQIYVNL